MGSLDWHLKIKAQGRMAHLSAFEICSQETLKRKVDYSDWLISTIADERHGVQLGAGPGRRLSSYDGD